MTTRLVVFLLLLLPGVARGEDDVERWLTDLVGRDEAKATVATDSLRVLGPTVVARVVTTLEACTERRGRARAMALLSKFPGSAVARQALVRRLSDSDEKISGAAAQLLSRIGAPAVGDVTEVIEHGSDPKVRTLAVMLLAHMPSGSPGLEGAARTALADPAPHVRGAGLHLVSWHAHDLAAGLAASVGERLWDEDTNVRAAALSTYQLVLKTRVRPGVLLPQLMRRSLDRVGDPEELQGELDQLLVELLMSVQPGPILVLTVLWRQVLAFLVGLIAWLLVARRIPSTLSSKAGVTLHRLAVLCLPVASATWLLQPLTSRPWCSQALALQTQSEVVFWFAVLVGLGAVYAIACTWASQRPAAPLPASEAENGA